jgi:hypothetical protein
VFWSRFGNEASKVTRRLRRDQTEENLRSSGQVDRRTERSRTRAVNPRATRTFIKLSATPAPPGAAIQAAAHAAAFVDRHTSAAIPKPRTTTTPGAAISVTTSATRNADVVRLGANPLSNQVSNDEGPARCQTEMIKPRKATSAGPTRTKAERTGKRA